jgi:hypothetical protein
MNIVLRPVEMAASMFTTVELFKGREAAKKDRKTANLPILGLKYPQKRSQ